MLLLKFKKNSIRLKFIHLLFAKKLIYECIILCRNFCFNKLYKSQVALFVELISSSYSSFPVGFTQVRLVVTHKYIVIYIYKKLGRYIVFVLAFQRRIFSKMFLFFAKSEVTN